MKSLTKNKKWQLSKYLKTRQDDAAAIIKEGWMRFASDDLGNINTYPPVP